jgi:serine/threonine protein kinase
MNDPDITRDESKCTDDTTIFGNSTPQHMGRYRVERLLAKGGFGSVYLAHDDQLGRTVAIKVPHAKRVEHPEDAAAYLAEARMVAGLDHPNIVPVYDVGSAEQYPCFVVSKYIDGTDLSTRLQQSRLPLNESVELVATVAEVLHYAHTHGLAIGTLSRATSCWTGRASHSWPTSGWPCESRISDEGNGTPVPLPT